MLSIIKCTSITVDRECFAIVGKISSESFHTLNLSIDSFNYSITDAHHGDEDFPMAEHMRCLAVINRCSHLAKFVNFKNLTLGVPPCLVKASQDYFTQTSLKGMVDVTTIEKVEALPYIAHAMHTISM